MSNSMVEDVQGACAHETVLNVRDVHGLHGGTWPQATKPVSN